MRLFNKKEKSVNRAHYSIQITDEGCCIANTSRTDDDKATLETCEYFPWVTGVPDEKQLREKLKSLELIDFPCSTMLKVGNYDIMNVEKPNVPEEEVSSAVRWSIKDTSSYDINEAVLEVFDAPSSGGHNQQEYTNVVIVPKEKIMECSGFLNKAGVNLTTIDIPELVLRNIISLLPENESGVLFLYLTPQQGLVILVRDSILYLARKLDVGYENLQAPDDGATSEGNDLQNKNQNMEYLGLELLRSIDFCNRYFPDSPIAKVVIAPMEGKVPRLLHELKDILGLTVRHLDLNECLEYKIPMDNDMQAKCLLTIGAALRDNNDPA